jgi:predicted phage terminase large subunit-like protein
LGHDPSGQLLCASYVQDLADKLSRDCRRIVASDWYQKLFPATRLSPTRQAVPEFETTALGCRLATSVGGVLTGRGADMIIIDDPLKPEEALSQAQRQAANEWFNHTLYSRLNDKRRGAIVVIMHRLHEDDLAGHVQAQEPWEVVCYPAIAEADETWLIETPLETRWVARSRGEALHPEREPLELKRAVREQAYAFAASVVLIEDKASGTQLIQELVAEGVHAVTRYQPQSDKVMRMHAQTAMIENGFVHLPKEAAWLAEYLHELTAFPKGKHDDQVDSTAQMLDWFKRGGQEPQDWMWIQYKQALARGPEPTRREPLSVMAKRLGILRPL